MCPAFLEETPPFSRLVDIADRPTSSNTHRTAPHHAIWIQDSCLFIKHDGATTNERRICLLGMHICVRVFTCVFLFFPFFPLLSFSFLYATQRFSSWGKVRNGYIFGRQHD